MYRDIYIQICTHIRPCRIVTSNRMGTNKLAQAWQHLLGAVQAFSLLGVAETFVKPHLHGLPSTVPHVSPNKAHQPPIVPVCRYCWVALAPLPQALMAYVSPFDLFQAKSNHPHGRLQKHSRPEPLTLIKKHNAKT